MSSCISLNAVSQEFAASDNPVTLFKNLSIQVNSRESHAVIGPSGVGKSSLLMLLAGLEKPSQGTFSFVHQGHQKSINDLRQCSGFVFQQFHLLPELDAINNIALPLKLKGDKDVMDKANNWLKRLGLANRAKHKPAQLSGGEQQRIAIARALISKPEFIFADEPTGNLDERTSQQISELMFECCAENQAAIVLVTHSLQLANRTQYVHRLENARLISNTKEG